MRPGGLRPAHITPVLSRMASTTLSYNLQSSLYNLKSKIRNLQSKMPQPPHIAQINTPAGFIDLGRGDPQFDLLPLDVIRVAAHLRLDQAGNTFLQYGAEQGDGYFRIALADFLSRGYGFPVDPDSLFVTSGISGALDLFCTLHTHPGDTVFVEEPSYFLALRIFADHGLKVIPIPTDTSGLVPESLEQALKQHKPRFLYVIPVFQNPSGHTLTEDRRRRLVELCRERGILLLADEVYQFLNYTVQSPASFGSHIDSEQVVSLGSFSKILAPGLRLGWLQANPTVIRRLVASGLLDSGGGMNPFTSAVIRGVIEAGDLDINIARLKRVYGARMAAMDALLRRHLPDARYSTPQGGYFFWLQLPGRNLDDLRKGTQSQQVDYRPGTLFSSQAGLRDYLRLSISFYGSDDLERGVIRLAESLEAQK
jgi:2-aminoadipate transaminase